MSFNRCRVGESYNDLIVVGFDESGHGYRAECLGKATWHQAVYSGMLLDSGLAHCKECADLEKAWEERRKRHVAEQTALAAGTWDGLYGPR